MIKAKSNSQAKVGFPYSSSLEAKQLAYAKQLEHVSINERIQLASNKLVREGELMNMTQAEIMNRLRLLQEELKKQNVQAGLIPFNKTSSPISWLEQVEEKASRTPSTGARSRTHSLGSLFQEMATKELKKTPPIKTKERKPSKLEDEIKKTKEKIEGKARAKSLDVDHQVGHSKAEKNARHYKKVESEYSTLFDNKEDFKNAMKIVNELPSNKKVEYMSQKIASGRK